MLPVKVLLLCFCIADLTHSQTIQDIYRLYDHFANVTHHKGVRPIYNQSEPIQVDINQVLISVDSIDEIRGTLDTRGYIFMSWKNELLRWDPSLYGNIDSTYLSTGDYWIPDIYLDDVSVTEDAKPITIIDYEGKMRTYVATSLQTRCKMDTSLYPFDSHTCTFTYYSGKHNATQLILIMQTEFILTFNFVENFEWTIVRNFSEVATVSTHDSEVLAMMYKTTLVIKRRSAFILLHHFLPCVLLMVLNLFTGLVPLNSGERLSYSVTISLAFVFLMNTVTEDLPVNSMSISIASLSFVFVNVTNSLTVLLSVVFVKLTTMDSKTSPIPRILQALLRWKRKSNKHVTPAMDENASTKNTGENNPETNDYHVSKLQEIETVDARECTADTVKEIEPHIRKLATNMSWTDVAKALDDLYFKFLLAITILLCLIMTVVFWEKGAF